jgi:ATP-dependent Lon protease
VIPAALRKGLEFHYVDTMEELLELALVGSDE